MTMSLNVIFKKVSNDDKDILEKVSDDGDDIFEKVFDDAKDILVFSIFICDEQLKK